MLKRIYKIIVVLFITGIIAFSFILDSPTGKQMRYEDLKIEFRESSFSGVVTAVKQSKRDHNRWKIYYGENRQLDLTWFENTDELIKTINIGDSILKIKGQDEIKVYSNDKVDEIKIEILR